MYCDNLLPDEERHASLLAQCIHDAEIAAGRVRFIQEVSDGTLPVLQTPLSRADFAAVLREHEYPAAAKGNSGDSVSNSAAFDYLLRMPMSSLTSEHIARLSADRAQLLQFVAELRSSTPEDLWRKDLEALRASLTADLGFGAPDS